MGDDPDVRKESMQLEREFAHAAWEAFQHGESDHHQADRGGIEASPRKVEAEA
jgi:hypothetical protein